MLNELDSKFNIYIYLNIRTGSNLKLEKQITITTKQARKNYDSRKNK